MRKKSERSEVREERETERSGFRYNTMDEREQILSYIQSPHTTGICGVQDLVIPAFFREVFEEL